jgi:two-component system sensor histidine kinase YesM
MVGYTRNTGRSGRAGLPRKLAALSVGRKLILIYVFGIFVPLAVANGLVLRGALRDAAEQERLYLTSLIESLQAAISREMEPIELVSDFVYAETPIYRLLGSDYPRFDRFMEAHRDYLVPSLTKYANVFAGITRITVYTENRIVNTSVGYLGLKTRSRDSEWFRRYEALGRSMVTFSHLDRDPRTELTPTRYISLLRELDNPGMHRRGRLILRIDINPQAFARHAAPAELVGTIELVDAFGTVAIDYSRGEPSEGAVQFDSPFPETGPLGGWRIRGTVSGNSGQDPHGLRWTLLFVVSGLSVAASSLLIMLLSRSVVSRLELLSAQMRRVEREDFRPLSVSDPGEDEVGRLITDFNIMARKIESLINDRYKSELERQRLIVARQQAELDSLQSQVNPHYLFNVLESVRMKSHIRGEHETAGVVKRISRSIRRLTSWDEDMIPLHEELQFTNEYIEIQQYRFAERLGFTLDCDSSVASIRVPKLTIQGLVENACVHGVEPKTGGGTVGVKVTLASGELRIAVTDDGVGCDQEKVRVQLSNGSSSGRHIGIANIFKRLLLHFGDRAHFDFQSSPGDGTTVSIVIEGINAVTPPPHG